MAVVATAQLTACSTQAHETQRSADPSPSSSSTSEALPSEALRTARDYLVTPEVLPQLTGPYSSLNAEDLADEASNPEVESRLQAAGFLAGAQRELRGRSRDITGADSRTLVFSTPAGARSFARFLASEPDPFFGGPSVVHGFRVGATKGVIIKPPLCDCPGAYPVYVGLVADGPRLLWLQLTGPKASTAKVQRYLSAFV